jgi:putative addiction module component (TIGR02574 family)
LFAGQGYNSGMNDDPGRILTEALALPLEARAALVDSLLESLDTEVDENAELEWRREIQRRVAELNRGTVSPVPWTEVRSRLMAVLRHER